ncbi:MAG: hypothetical protein JNK10_09115 [Cyclobacteriaceae bacterium]|nr:hypothetical protein [Cyclobacteriaceae bacterium]
MKSRLFISIMLVFGLGCSEDVTVKPYTYTKFFTGEVKKTWKISFLEETLNGEVIDSFTVNCSTDDEYVFYNNFEHTFEVHTGSKKCESPSEAALITDTWSFTNASATLSLILPIFTTDFALPAIVREAGNDKMELELFFDNDKSSYRIHFAATDED